MDFSTYLETLPSTELSSLYSSPWTCQAVLRSLPAMSQQFVLRLLHLEGPIPDAWLSAWVTTMHERKARDAVGLLRRLRVLQRDDPPGSTGKHWVLEPTFKSKLQHSVADPSSLGHAEASAAAPPAATDLSAFAESQWEQLLLVLVSETRHKTKPVKLQELGALAKLDVASLLVSTGLLTSSVLRKQWGAGASGDVTNQGFRFLFEDVYSQLWSLIKQYLSDASQGTGLRLSDVLSFLLQLAFRKLTEVQATQPLCVDSLSPGQQEVAADMACLGLLKPVRMKQGRWLYPTFLAALLCGTSTSTSAGPSDVGGFIVVETSFRVYAYTASPVQIKILQLFTRTECILPNLYVGTISSSSVSTALKRGISAAMIVRYLEHHRHAKVAHRVPVLPEAVRDQIMLWESEINRVRHTLASYYEGFASRASYDKVAAKAVELGVLVFRDDEKQRLVVEAHAHTSIRDFMRANKS